MNKPKPGYFVEMISDTYVPTENIEIPSTVSDKIVKILSEYTFEQQEGTFFSSFSLNSLLFKFREDLKDPASNASIFLEFLATAELKDYAVVKEALYELFYEDYLDNFFSYLEGNSSEISFELISSYLVYRQTEQVRIVKEKLVNETYKSYGNPYMFIINNVIGDPANRITEFKEELVEDYLSFRVKAKTDYLENNAYRNLREAEEAYFTILEEFAVDNGFTYTTANSYGMTFPSGYNTNLSKGILATLFNKAYNNSVKGVALLMASPSKKSIFSNDMTMDKNIFLVLSNSYKLISKAYFYDSFQTMVEDMVEYAKVNTLSWDTWEEDDILESFLTDKLSELDSSASEYTIEKLRELRFYKSFLARYLGVTTDSSFDKLDEITSEMDSLRVVLVSAGEYLKQEGFFI